MGRALLTFLIAFVLVPGEALTQSVPSSSPAEQSPAQPGALKVASVPKAELPSSQAVSAANDPSLAPPDLSPNTLRGRVLDLEGGMIAGASVSVFRFAEPSRSLAETSTDSRGNFTVTLPESEKTSGLAVKASTPSGLEGRELLHFLSVTEDHPLQLLLRKPEENYDEPSMDAVDAWLVERIMRIHGPKPTNVSASDAIRILGHKKRQRLSAWDRVAEALRLVRQHDAPEIRLVATAALMRLGAWETAREMLAGVEDSHFGHEKSVLEGARLNFLRFPHEANQLLERTLLEDSVDPFAQLELGRAAVMLEDWPSALQRLDPALKDKKLAPHAHYLRARALFALGDIEAAAQETRLLTRRVKKKRLPVQVRSFVDDLRGRLAEESLQALQSVMSQPIPELKKAVPNLADLDTSPLPPGRELPVILKKVGENIERFFREFSNTSSLEVLRQSSLDNKGKSHAVRRAEMYYVFQQKSLKGRPMLEEIRGTAEGKLHRIGGLEDGFMVTTGFASSLIILHPAYQPTVDYRYLGRQEMAGKTVYVVGFAQRPEESTPMGVFRSAAFRTVAQVYVQGVAWITSDHFQVVRLRMDLLEPIVEAELYRETSEIDYRPYHFLTTSKTYFLPSRVTVSIKWRNRRLRNEHIFSRFWLFNVEADSGEDRRLVRSKGLPAPVAAH